MYAGGIRPFRKDNQSLFQFAIFFNLLIYAVTSLPFMMILRCGALIRVAYRYW